MNRRLRRLERQVRRLNAKVFPAWDTPEYRARVRALHFLSARGGAIEGVTLAGSTCIVRSEATPLPRSDGAQDDPKTQ